ncbi:ABC transporter permease [Desulfotignum phosphitoxidans]|uniref:Putative ABC-type transport system, permease component n=1 Tax=Desulfotignum phosphitoxidans DSM 13687 TaxID=1286635 RepID=S0FZB2_9BACT|nr:FtsX-like permease family protein [Desulfotignum phosphitoxidans]EMS78554.1 putative ABC-type transport system, permease component [Desulfotignum phosphitoxidans DSM 13687]
MVSRVLIRISLRHSRRHLLRTLLLIFGIAMGVAGVVAIDIAKTSVEKSFDLSTTALVSRSTHQILGADLDIPQTTFTMIRTRLGIHASAPVISRHVTIPELEDRVLTLMGVDPFSETHFRTLPLASENRDLSNVMTGSSGVFLAQTLGDTFGLKIGSPLTISMGDRQITVTLAGFLEGRDKRSNLILEGLMVTDISVAQEILDMKENITRIDLILPSRDTAAEIRNHLEKGLFLVETDQQNQAVRSLSRSFENSLTAFSMLALFMGIFLIYNTVSFSVSRRHRLHAILRALGTTRNEVFFTVMAEVMLYAVIGAVSGVVLGILMGTAAVQAVTATVSEMYFTLTVGQTQITGATLAKGLVAGVLTSLIAGLFPALAAAGTRPVSLMHKSVSEYRFQRMIPGLFILGLIILTAAGLLMKAGHDHAGYDFSGLFMIFFGAALLTPLIIRMLVRALLAAGSRVLGIMIKMALRNITRSLRQTSVLMASLMVVTSVYIGIGVMTGSFRQSIVQWVDDHIGGHVHVSSADERNPSLDPALVEKIKSLPEVAAVSAYNIHPVFSRAAGKVHLFSYQSNQSKNRWSWTAAPEPELDALLEKGWIFVSEIFARQHQVEPEQGAAVVLETRQGPVSFQIAGIFRDFFMGGGRVVMSRETMARFWGHDDITAMQLFLENEISVNPVINTIKQMIPPGSLIQLQPGADIKQSILAVFDNTFVITSALQVLTAIVALTGILNAVMALLLERTREIGILRACGTLPGQVRGLLIHECFFYGLLSGIMAIPLGIALSWILIHVINQRTFGWTYDMILSPGILVQALVLSSAAALAAGIFPALAAGRIRISEALHME